MSRKVLIAVLCAACLVLGSTEVFAIGEGVLPEFEPSMSFDGFLYGRDVKIDRGGFCGFAAGGGPYHSFTDLAENGVPQPATCSEVNNIPALLGVSPDDITVHLTDFELTCLKPDPSAPLQHEKRLYSGGYGELLVNDVAIDSFFDVFIEVDVSCFGGNPVVLGKAWGTMEPLNPLGEAVFHRFKEFGGTDQVEVTFESFDPIVQGVVGTYEYNITMRPADHEEFLEVQEVIEGGPFEFGDVNTFLTFASLTKGGDVTFQGDFRETLGAVNVRQILADPGPLPQDILDIAPHYWRICTLLKEYNADLGFVFPPAHRPGDLVILHRPDDQSPWEIYPNPGGIVDGKILANDVVAFSEWTIGSTTADNFVPLGFINGIVTATDGASVWPVEDAYVHAWSESRQEGYDAHSRADGFYLIGGVPSSDDYIVSVEADGYVPRPLYYVQTAHPADADSVEVIALDTTYAIAFILTPEEMISVDVFIPEGLVAAPGSEIRIPVQVDDDVTGLGIISAQMEILYDGNLLIPIRRELADTITDETWEMSTRIVPGASGEPDTAKVAMAGINPLEGDGALVWGVFQVSPNAQLDACTDLVFEYFMFNEGTPEADTYGGDLCVGEPALVGDVSENGQITAFDASIILRFRVGFTDENEYPGLRAAVADVTQDGGVTALDASYILRHVVGIVPSLPVPPEFLVKPVVAMRNVWLGAPERSAEGVRVPIHVDEMAGILSGEMVLSFDGEEIEAGASELTSEYLFASRVSEGKVRVAFAGAESVEGSGVLAYLRIGVPSDAFDLGALRLDRVVLNDGGIVVQLTERLDTPGEYHLAQNRPNPFNPSTTIQFRLPASGRVLLSVYNARGQLLRTLVSGFRDAGVYTAMWDGTDASGRSVSSGVYFYRLEANTFRETKKMLLMK